MRELRLIHVLNHLGLLVICCPYRATASAGEIYDLGLKEENEAQVPSYSPLTVQPVSAFEFGRSLVRGRRYIASSFPELHQGTKRHVTKSHKKSITTGRPIGKARKKQARKIKTFNLTVERPVKKMKLSSDIPSLAQPSHTFLQFIIRPKTTRRLRQVSLSVPDTLLAEAKGLQIGADKGHINITQGASSFFLPMDTDFFKGVLSGQRKRSNFNDTQHAREMTIVNIEILEMPKNDKSSKQFSSENATQPAVSTEPLHDSDSDSVDASVNNLFNDKPTRSIKGTRQNYSGINFGEEIKPKNTTHGRVQKAGIDIIRRLTTVASFSDGKSPTAVIGIDDLFHLIVSASSNKQEKPMDKERSQLLDTFPVYKRKLAPVENNDSSDEVVSTTTGKEEKETAITTDTIDRDNTVLPPISSDVLVIANHSNFTCFYSTFPVLKNTEITGESGDQTEKTLPDTSSDREIPPILEVNSGPPSEVTGIDPNKPEHLSNVTERVRRRKHTTTTPFSERSSTPITQTDSDSLLSVISMIGSYAVEAMIQTTKTEENKHGNETEGSGTLSDDQTLPIPIEDVTESNETTTTSSIPIDQSKNVRAHKFKKHLAENNFENITSPTPVIYVLTGVTDTNPNSPQDQMARSLKGTRKRRKTIIFNSYTDKEEEQIRKSTEKTVRNRTRMLYILSHLEKPLQSIQNCNFTLGDLCTPLDNEQEQANNATESGGNEHSVPFPARRSTARSAVHDEPSEDLAGTLQSIHKESSNSNGNMSEDRHTMPTVENHEYFSSTPSNISDVESSNSVESNEGNVSDVSNQTDVEKLQGELDLRNLFETVHTAIETPSQNEQGFMQITALHNLIHEFVMRILEFLKKTQDQGTPSPNVTAKHRSLTHKPDINSTMHTVDESTKPKKSRGRRRTVKFLGFIHSSTTSHPKTMGQL